MNRIPAESGRKNPARRDIALVVVVAVIATVVCVRFNVSEALLAWTRPLEWLQLDELPSILLVVAVSLIWFSSRRYFEADRQLQLRRSAEGRLAEALAENQRLAQQYIDMQEHERKALARDLHDELGQYINAIKLDAVSMRESLADDPGIRKVALAMIANIDRVYGVVTGLIRQLRPVGFDDLGVVAALEHCILEWRSRLPATTIDVSITGEFDSLDETRSLVLFRLVQEALTNVARHSAATRVEIRIDMPIADAPITDMRETVVSRRCVAVAVTDNGRGVEINAPRQGLGLVGMRERVTALGGSTTLASAPGSGFKVTALIPLVGAPL